jgi:hypothetical protein
MTKYIYSEERSAQKKKVDEGNIYVKRVIIWIL